MRSIVIAPARTGRERRSKMAVIRTDHTNSGIFLMDLVIFMFKIVEIKFNAPRIEDAPAR